MRCSVWKKVWERSRRHAEVKDTIARKKAGYRVFRFSSEESKNQYERFRSQTWKVVARAMIKEAKQELNNLFQNSSSVFYLLRKNEKGNEGSRRRKVLKRKRRTVEFIEKDRAKIGKEHLEKILKRTNSTRWWNLML